jgi:hypothetical protein
MNLTDVLRTVGFDGVRVFGDGDGWVNGPPAMTDPVHLWQDGPDARSAFR